jgi:hypothetical protein
MLILADFPVHFDIGWGFFVRIFIGEFNEHSTLVRGLDHCPHWQGPEITCDRRDSPAVLADAADSVGEG